MKRGTACASGSSGSLTSESITDVFIPLSSLRADFPLIQTTQCSLPSSLLSPPPSSHFFSFHVPESLPSLYFLSFSLGTIPAPAACPCRDVGRLCTGQGAGYFTVPLTFSTHLLLGVQPPQMVRHITHTCCALLSQGESALLHCTTTKCALSSSKKGLLNSCKIKIQLYEKVFT